MGPSDPVADTPLAFAGAVVDREQPWCRVCGGQPAAAVTFTQGVGLVLLRHVRNSPGPFCRDCGRQVGRSVQQKTLITGWWGIISFFMNFAILFSNAGSLMKVGSLAEPAGGDPHLRRNPGRPFFLRVGVLATFAVFLAVIVFIFYPRTPVTVSPSVQAKVGQCISVTATANRFVPCSQPHDARVVAAVSHWFDCPSTARAHVVAKDDAGQEAGTLCLSEA